MEYSSKLITITIIMIILIYIKTIHSNNYGKISSAFPFNVKVHPISIIGSGLISKIIRSLSIAFLTIEALKPVSNILPITINISH